MAKFAAFHDTRNLFIELTQYTGPLSYEEWSKYPDDLKAALLFVQFYNEITLAWDKANTLDFIEAEDGVSTVLQYLEKQVRQPQWVRKDDHSKKASAELRRTHPEECEEVVRRIIDENPNKFSPSYIYRVAYNCLYCICHDRICDKERLANETSPFIQYGDETLCVFDTVSDSHGSAEDVSSSNSFEAEFWRIVEDEGQSAEKVMRYLLSNDKADLRKRNKKSPIYNADPLRDIEVSFDQVEEIVSRIREKLLDLPASSKCGEYILSLI